jgi:hypothetical protein
MPDEVNGGAGSDLASEKGPTYIGPFFVADPTSVPARAMVQSYR